MYLKNIHIVNFRGIENQSFNFDPKFNVIIGENAVGKTSLMEAISVALGGFVKGLYYRNGRSITRDDIRIIDYRKKIRQAEYAKIITSADLLGQEFIWERYREKDSELNDLNYYIEVFELGRHLASESKSGRFVTLPIISNYGVGRLLKENDSSFNPDKTTKRLDGYNRALNPNSNYKTLLSWFKATEISVYKSGKQIDAIKSVKRAVINSFENIETLYFDYDNDMLSVLFKGNGNYQSKPVWTLSDGQKVLIGLIGDIALRCNLLNPRAEEYAHEITPGIVLIDELDLHLHPNWQKQIVTILKTTFPKIQFITTTHSPFITQSLSSESIINLGEPKDVNPNKMRVDEVATTVMGVDSAYSKNNENLYQQSKAILTKIQENATSEEINDEIYKIHDPAVRAFLELNKMANGK